MRPTLALAALAVALAPATASAQLHDVQGLVSPGGLEFIAAQVPSYLPTHLSLNDISGEFACVTATQRDTEIDLEVGSFAVSIPRPGRLTVDVTLSATGTGELFAEDVIACLGDVTCQDAFSVSDMRTIVELDVTLANGMPRVTVASIDVQVGVDDVELSFSGCAVGDLATWVVDYARESVVDLMKSAVAGGVDRIAAWLEELLIGLGYAGEVGPVEFDAAIDELVVDEGIELGAAVELENRYPPDPCIADLDRGEPADVPGPRPSLSSGPQSHLGLAANLGVVNGALYHMWRSGILCLDAVTLAALGLHVPLEMAAEVMPGFPPGTALGLEILLKKPLAVGGVMDDDARVTLRIEELEVALTGRLPDGGERRVVATISATATAEVAIEPASNALVGQLVEVDLETFEIDQLSATELGFDVQRMAQVIETLLVPHLMEELGAMPLTGPVLSLAGYAVILRALATSDAYLTVKTDLFRVPTDDVTPPDTALIDLPHVLASPKTARFVLSGTDTEIPYELLRYRITVDGVERPQTFVREFKVGAAGETSTYDVEVRAVDLSGNVDPTPATATVMVDGIAPRLTLLGDRMREVEGTIDLEWLVSDDLTPAASIATHLVIYEVTDSSDHLAVLELETRTLPAGSTTAAIEGLASDELYRIEVHATDSVGNDASASVLVDLRTGGCRAGGGASAGATLLVALALGLGLGASRRRRRA